MTKCEKELVFLGQALAYQAACAVREDVRRLAYRGGQDWDYRAAVNHCRLAWDDSRAFDAWAVKLGGKAYSPEAKQIA